MIKLNADSNEKKRFIMSYVNLSNQSSSGCQNMIGFLGIPYDSGAGNIKGASFAPDSLRSIFHKLPLITRDGIDVSGIIINDLGNIKVYPDSWEKTSVEIRRNITEIIRNYSFPLLTIGGDHSITYATVSAFSQNDNMGLIWFDAHPDSLDEYINSKYSHGSPLRRIVEDKLIKPENILIVGTRYYDGDEFYFIRGNDINEISMHHINTTNYKELFVQKINEISARTSSFYVSIDIDVLDPAFAPGTGSLVPIGMAPFTLIEFLELLPKDIYGFDIVEYCPGIDVNMMTGKLILFIISEIMKRLIKN